VYAGPSDYIAENHFSFTKGDEIEVTGSKVVMENKDTLLARELKKTARRSSYATPKEFQHVGQSVAQ